MKQAVLKQKNNMVKMTISAMCLSFLFIAGMQAQILDSENRIEVILGDGTPVVMYGKAKFRRKHFTNKYYFLPTNLHLLSRPDGTKDFSLFKYTFEKTDMLPGILLHSVMEWGLTPQQEAEALAKLKTKIEALRKTPDSPYRNVKKPILVGVAEIDMASFQALFTALTDDGMTKVAVSGDALPVLGGKIVVVTKLDKTAIKLLMAIFEQNRPVTDVSIELSIKYNVSFLAVDGHTPRPGENLNKKTFEITLPIPVEDVGYRVIRIGQDDFFIDEIPEQQ